MCQCPLFFLSLFQWTSYFHLTHILPLSLSVVSLCCVSVVLILSPYSDWFISQITSGHHCCRLFWTSLILLSSPSSLSILLFSFCHFDASVFFEAQAINLCRSVPTKISQFQGRRWREVRMVMGGVSPARIDPASHNVLSDTAGSHHKHP